VEDFHKPYSRLSHEAYEITPNLAVLGLHRIAPQNVNVLLNDNNTIFF